MTSDDTPWCNSKIKHIKRLNNREYNKPRGSEKWKNPNNRYKIVLTEAKHKYYKNTVKDLKTSNPYQWYSKVIRMCFYDQTKFEPIICSEIENLTDQEQAEKIAKQFYAVRKKFNLLRFSDIEILYFSDDSNPHFLESEIKSKLLEIDPKKSVSKEDIPPKIFFF